RSQAGASPRGTEVRVWEKPPEAVLAPSPCDLPQPELSRQVAVRQVAGGHAATLWAVWQGVYRGTVRGLLKHGHCYYGSFAMPAKVSLTVARGKLQGQQ